MDMNLRELLIVLGSIIVAGVVLDGFRRMRRAKRDSLEMSVGMGGEIENTPLDDGFNPELPNGGARVLGELDSNEQELPTLSASTETISTGTRIVGERIEPSMGDVDSTENNYSAVRVVPRDPEIFAREPEVETAASIGEKTSSSDEPKRHQKQSKRQAKKAMTFGEGLKANASIESKAQTKDSKSNKPSHVENKPQSDKKIQKKPAQEVIILNVLSKTERGFQGPELKQLLEACGMEHGEMSIFHRHEMAIDTPVQFSVANAVEPGVFPVELLDTLTTPGICFFMSLPGPDDSMKAFEYMVETAQCVVNNLSGEMKDERRSDMTPQTLEHCRQRIKDFERRQLAVRC